MCDLLAVMVMGTGTIGAAIEDIETACLRPVDTPSPSLLVVLACCGKCRARSGARVLSAPLTTGLFRVCVSYVLSGWCAVQKTARKSEIQIVRTIPYWGPRRESLVLIL